MKRYRGFETPYKDSIFLVVEFRPAENIDSRPEIVLLSFETEPSTLVKVFGPGFSKPEGRSSTVSRSRHFFTVSKWIP